MNQKQEPLQKLKEEIQHLGLNSLKNFLVIDPMDIKNKEALMYLMHKAKIGMSFEREMNLSQRAVEMNQLRIFKLTSQDKKELKRLIKESLPKYHV